MNFLERCLPELGIANSCPITYPIVPNGYMRMFLAYFPTYQPIDNVEIQSDGDTSIPKIHFPKGLMPALTSASNNNF